MRNAVPTERLNRLRTDGKTRQEIADELGVTLSQVKRWIAKASVVTRKRKKKPKNRDEDRPRYASPDEGVSILEQAKQILGPRMGEDHRGYTLDGRPVSSWALLRAAKLCPER